MNNLFEIMLLLLAVGAGGGFLSGLLGVGGGIIFVPSLYFALSSAGIDPDHVMHIAVASSMFVIIASVGSSAITHYRNGNSDKDIIKSWMPFIIAGTVAGIYVASLVGGSALKILFVIFTMAVAFYMGFSDSKNDAPRRIPFLTPAVQKFLCFLIGILCTMIGMGGGVLTIPLMRFIGTPIKKAIGTGAALGVAVAIPAVIGHIFIGLQHAAELPPYSLGYVNLLAVGFIIPTALPMAYLGAKASERIDRALLQRAFAVLLVIVSLRMLWSL